MRKSLLLSLFAFALICVPAEVSAKAICISPSKQGSDWTSEQIKENQEKFLNVQLRKCEELSHKIKIKEVDYMRSKIKFERKLKDSQSTANRCTKWLAQAKESFKKIKDGKANWPINISGIDIPEDEFKDVVQDALDRLERANKAIVRNEKMAKKLKIKQNALKNHSRKIFSYRRDLTQKLEDLKMNQVFDESDLKEMCDDINDVSIELTEDPTKFSLDDFLSEDQDGSVTESVDEFLNS